MAENIYKEKIISVLGDSISTFYGVIPEKNAARYPQDNLLTDVNLTWWSRVITALSARLGFNDSWAGSQVSNVLDKRDEDNDEDDKSENQGEEEDDKQQSFFK